MIKIINKYYEPELKQVRVVMLEDELNKLLQEIERLNNIIDKAIKYIEHAQNYAKEKCLYVNGDDILDILKGVDKE